MQKNIQKNFFDFEIIAYEFFVLDTRFYWKRILVFGVNMSTNNIKISTTTKTQFFDLISFQSAQKYDKNTLVHI